MNVTNIPSSTEIRVGTTNERQPEVPFSHRNTARGN